MQFMRSARISAEQWATARIFGWIEWCNLCDPQGSRPNNGPQQADILKWIEWVQFMRSGGITAEQWATARIFGWIEWCNLPAIRRDHGQTVGPQQGYLGGQEVQFMRSGGITAYEQLWATARIFGWFNLW